MWNNLRSGAKPESASKRVEQLDLDYVSENATMMERTALSHLSPEEIAPDQQELTCRTEIENQEMQEAALDYELYRSSVSVTRRGIPESACV
jgi:hypothetical protein